MTGDLTYTRTKSGESEAGAVFSMLRPELKQLLELVDPGLSFAALQGKAPQLSEIELRRALDELTTSGYLETNAGRSKARDLDITLCLARPVAEPTLQRRQEAEKQTIAGMQAHQKAGYVVNILSRPGRRILPRLGNQYQVLIIDADEYHTLVLARALLLAGFDARVAGSRDEIVAGLNRQPAPDAIVMDVVLPDVIGLDLLGRLRESDFFKTVPIIVTTSRAGHDDVVAALAYGASCYMTKPFKPETLVENVKAVLGVG